MGERVRLAPEAVISLAAMGILADQATSMTIGLIVTFGGIGLIVNGLIVYILIQVRGERHQNLEYRSSRRNGGP